MPPRFHFSLCHIDTLIINSFAFVHPTANINVIHVVLCLVRHSFDARTAHSANKQSIASLDFLRSLNWLFVQDKARAIFQALFSNNCCNKFTIGMSFVSLAYFSYSHVPTFKRKRFKLHVRKNFITHLTLL